MPVIWLLRKWRQQVFEFKDSLGKVSETLFQKTKPGMVTRHGGGFIYS
jgi:hypothetical protein